MILLMRELLRSLAIVMTRVHLEINQVTLLSDGRFNIISIQLIGFVLNKKSR